MGAMQLPARRVQELAEIGQRERVDKSTLFHIDFDIILQSIIGSLADFRRPLHGGLPGK
jgi:hypothetical protein